MIGTKTHSQSVCATELLQEVEAIHNEDFYQNTTSTRKRKWNIGDLEDPIAELYKYKWSAFNVTTNPSKDRDKVVWPDRDVLTILSG